jgi:hypothetical protein
VAKSVDHVVMRSSDSLVLPMNNSESAFSADLFASLARMHVDRSSQSLFLCSIEKFETSRHNGPALLVVSRVIPAGCVR